MLNRISYLSMIITLLILSSSLRAQGTLILSGEFGYAQIESGSGFKKSVPMYGGTISVVIGGSTDKSFAVQFPIYGELKSDNKFKNTDLIAGGDLAFRIRNFSFGPGMNYGYVGRGDVEDQSCLNQAPSLSSTCHVAEGGRVNNGLRDVSEINLLGLSGFAKLSFGPQGRAFIQGRYAYYGKSMGVLMNRSGIFARGNIDPSLTSLIPDFDDLPSFDGGRDIRITAGYVFGRWFARAQYTDRKFEFARERGNLNGAFDQKTHQLTGGVGLVF